MCPFRRFWFGGVRLRSRLGVSRNNSAAPSRPASAGRSASATKDEDIDFIMYFCAFWAHNEKRPPERWPKDFRVSKPSDRDRARRARPAVARKAEGREAEAHQHPSRRLGNSRLSNRGWAKLIVEAPRSARSGDEPANETAAALAEFAAEQELQGVPAIEAARSVCAERDPVGGDGDQVVVAEQLCSASSLVDLAHRNQSHRLGRRQTRARNLQRPGSRQAAPVHVQQRG